MSYFDVKEYITSDISPLKNITIYCTRHRIVNDIELYIFILIEIYCEKKKIFSPSRARSQDEWSREFDGNIKLVRWESLGVVSTRIDFSMCICPVLLPLMLLLPMFSSIGSF